MTTQEVTGIIQSVCAVGGFVFAFLAWWRANHVAKVVVEVAKTVVAVSGTVLEVSDKVDRVEHSTNGLKKELEDAARRSGRREGVIAGIAQEKENAATKADGFREGVESEQHKV